MNRLLPWSHSKIELFEQCPKKAYHVHILKEKEVPEPPYFAEGNRVHKAFEDRIIGNRRLPPDLSKHETMMQSFKQKQADGYEVGAEVAYGIDVYGRPVDFWDQTVWGRGKSDLTIIHPSRRMAVILDYKTGKKKESDIQISRLALMLFAAEPALEKVTGANIWLSENKVGKNYEVVREQLPAIRGTVERVLESVVTAEEKDNWPEKPSGLCGFCHITSCRFSKKRGC